MFEDLHEHEHLVRRFASGGAAAHEQEATLLWQLSTPESYQA